MGNGFPLGGGVSPSSIGDQPSYHSKHSYWQFSETPCAHYLLRIWMCATLCVASRLLFTNTREGCLELRGGCPPVGGILNWVWVLAPSDPGQIPLKNVHFRPPGPQDQRCYSTNPQITYPPPRPGPSAAQITYPHPLPDPRKGNRAKKKLLNICSKKNKSVVFAKRHFGENYWHQKFMATPTWKKNVSKMCKMQKLQKKCVVWEGLSEF